MLHPHLFGTRGFFSLMVDTPFKSKLAIDMTFGEVQIDRRIIQNVQMQSTSIAFHQSTEPMMRMCASRMG